jgi:hypothetical protein
MVFERIEQWLVDSAAAEPSDFVSTIHNGSTYGIRDVCVTEYYYFHWSCPVGRFGILPLAARLWNRRWGAADSLSVAARSLRVDRHEAVARSAQRRGQPSRRRLRGGLISPNCSGVRSHHNAKRSRALQSKDEE